MTEDELDRVIEELTERFAGKRIRRLERNLESERQAREAAEQQLAA